VGEEERVSEQVGVDGGPVARVDARSSGKGPREPEGEIQLKPPRPKKGGELRKKWVEKRSTSMRKKREK
jgi:hypothetical protein